MRSFLRMLAVMLAVLLMVGGLYPNSYIFADEQDQDVTLLFQDNFEDGDAGGWSREEGTTDLSVLKLNDNYCYCGSSAGATVTVAGDAAWSDYRLSADMRSNGIAYPALIFRYQSVSQFYMLLLDYEFQLLKLYKRNGAFTVLEQVSVNLTPNQTYDLQVDVKGNMIRVYMNDRLLVQKQDNTHLTGKIGFRAYNNPGNAGIVNCIDNVFVGDLSGIPAVPSSITGFMAEVVEVAISTVPQLPQRVIAKYEQGLDSFVNVVWEELNPAQFDEAGTIIVRGSVAGTTIRPEVAVTVVGPPSPEPPSGAALQPYERVPLPEDGDYYVSVQGNDDWSGLLRSPNVGHTDGPFLTLSKALAEVAAQKVLNQDRHYRIFLREGIYELNEPLLIDYSEISLLAFPGEKPIISGGEQLTGEWIEGADDIWTLSIPEAADGQWQFRQLFMDGERATRARYPNTGSFLTVQSVASDYMSLITNEAIPAAFEELQGVEINSSATWHYNRQKVALIQPHTKRIESVNYLGVEASGVKIKAGNKLFLENALQFVDFPGEWYLDKEAGVLHYKAETGLNPNDGSFVVPRLTTLLHIEGEQGEPLSGVNLYGITFSHTEWIMPDIERKGIQAGFWGRLREEAVYAPPGAVLLEHVQNSRIEESDFLHLGEGAIAVGAGGDNNLIHANRFDDVGANVIQIGWRETYTGVGHPLHLDWANSEDSPKGNIVSYNDIRNSATTDWGSVAIWVGYANYTHIHHNRIFNMPYTAISVGWRWGEGLSTAHHNISEWNYIEKIVSLVADGGGVYYVGEQPGSKIRHNVITDSNGTFLSNGLYLDEGANYVEVAYNYINDIEAYNILQNRVLTKNDVHNNYEDALPTAGSSHLYGPTTLEQAPRNLQSLMPDEVRPRLSEGEHRQLVISAVYSDRTTAEVTDEAEYISSDAGVATVTEFGILTAAGAGEATITILYGGQEVTIPVVVVEAGTQPVATLYSSEQVLVGESFELLIGTEWLTGEYQIYNVIIGYDPQKLRFAMSGEPGEEELESGSIEMIAPGSSLLGSAIVPEAGQINVVMKAGQERSNSNSFPLFKLVGQVGADNEPGETIVRLNKATAVAAAGVDELDVSNAVHTLRIMLSNKEELRSVIAVAEALHNASIEGTQPGEFPLGSKTMLLNAINAANEVNLRPLAVQNDIDSAKAELETAIATFRASEIPERPGDRTMLNAEIAHAESLYVRAREGSKLGYYESGAKAALNNAIAAARNAGISQTSIDYALVALRDAIEHFSTRIVTLVSGAAQVTLRDLAIVAQYYGMNNEDSAWGEIEKADVLELGLIDIRNLAAIAKMILNNWRLEV